MTIPTSVPDTSPDNRALNGVIAIQREFLVSRLFLNRDTEDAAADEDTTLVMKAPVSITYAGVRVAFVLGFVADPANTFQVQVTSTDPVTGLLRDTATATYVNLAGAANKWVAKAFDSPLTVVQGDLLNVTIDKLGTGQLLAQGAIELVP